MIGHISQWREMERWTSGGGTVWGAVFPMVPLGELLRPRRQTVPPHEFAQFQPITIHFDGSIVPRDRTAPFQGAMFAAQAGDLVYSKIDVRNGAVGLLPDNVPHAVVTSEYPVLIPDHRQVDASYLALLLRSSNFLHLLKSAATGTSGRKRVQGETFAELEIPLPELREQRRLLLSYETAQRRAKELEVEASVLEQCALNEFEAALGLVPPPDLPRQAFQIALYHEFDRWSHESVLHARGLACRQYHAQTTKVDMVALGEFVQVTHGCSASPSLRPTRLEVLKISAVTRGYLRPSEKKFAQDNPLFHKQFDLRKGDVLLCRTNGTLSYVGMSALVENTLANLIFPDKIIRLRIRRAGLLPEFLWRVLQLPSLRAQIESCGRTAVGNYAIGSTDVEDFLIPIPTETLQNKLMSSLRTYSARASAKRAQAAQLRSSAWNDFLAAIFA